MTAKKTAKKKPVPRKKTIDASRYVQLDRVGLRLDLTSLAAQQARDSLRATLETSEGGGLVQLRFDAHDFNEICIILPMRQLKSLAARLEALALSGAVTP